MDYSVHIEKENGIRRLVLNPESDSKFSREFSGTISNKLMYAAEWALYLDAQYWELLQAGSSPKVIIPSSLKWSVRRVGRETVNEYRTLRLGVGELLYPMLLDPPKLEKLYPFQLQGAQWLIDQKGGILADDMGLGKTVQVIAAMRLLFNRAQLRTALVVCPKGLISTWEREFSSWAPELGVAVLTPPSRIREEAWKTVTGRRHVILTNYEQLREVPDVLKRTPPDLIVADEAHRLRNRDAQVTSSSFQLDPKRFWAITGTPLERDVEDLATLLSIIAPKSFSPKDAKLHSTSLRSRARPYILRRRKEEVLEELPDVLDRTEILELSEAQEKTYKTTVKQYSQQEKSGDKLALLTRLQALCDIDPESRESSKVERILHLLGYIRKQQEKAVVFSYRLEPLRELKHRVTSQWGSDSAVLLIGEMNEQERNINLMNFRNNASVHVLLASSRIAGEGLTLVEANHVFLFNQWWNPSANNQTRDRVVRIGQQRKVHIYRFCCRGTIEEALEQILKSKEVLFNDTVERLAQERKDAWEQLVSEVGIDNLFPSK